MRSYCFLIIPFILLACGEGENKAEESEESAYIDAANEEGLNYEMDEVVDEIDENTSFNIIIGGGEYEMQLVTNFVDDQVELILYNGNTEWQVLPEHTANTWMAWENESGELPVEVEDFNEDGAQDFMITVEAMSGVGPEGAIPFEVQSIYFQLSNEEFNNIPSIDDNINGEMTLDEIKQMCADFDPNAG